MSSNFNLFGSTGGNQQGAANAGGNMFGGGNTSTAQPGGGLFGNAAATPAAGAPAAGAGAPGGGLFGNFGNTASNPSTTTPAAPALSGGLFGSTNTNAGAAPAPSGGLFGGAAPAPASNATPGAANAGGLFSGFGQPKPADSNAPKPATPNMFGTPSTNTTNPTPTPLFGGAPAAPSTSTATTGAAAAAPTPPAGGTLFGGGLFGKKPDTPAAGAGATGTTGTTTTPASNLFGQPAATPGASGAAAPGAAPATAATPGLFGAPAAAKPEEKKDGAAAAPAAAPTFGLFGAAKKPEEKKDGEKPAGAAPAPGVAGLGATTSAQVSVPTPSILRGKTIEEIVNKWTADLEEHVKSFGKFATEVAVWDRALIDSGNNLSALYATLIAAEREQNDVDQSLDHIEQQQRELAATLDAYEQVTDEILGSANAPSQAGGTGGLRSLDTGPADTERDRNYMLATELHGHLDDLSASLTQMIESVNGLSPTSTNLAGSTAGDGGAPANDDPLTQIAQVLANHLESLQWIDGAVREVETKVVDTERRVRSAAGDGGSGVASPRLGGSVGPGGGARGAGGIGGDYGVRFGGGR
ncbi:hypothetical protein PsYK624_005320 [Phanerochaete sordida]|uniref:Nucleoporin NSP1-like C-terminal domain-containing protein n=1 Tax=Phanerochaete sordida TaxID=48140 RepID=A0A9P3FXL5_9APHY|nr:hypothetical protein PsYK624_005320 [Phanerochaete sordida]